MRPTERKEMSEFKFPATLVSEGGKSVVTAFNVNATQPIHMADSFHPHFDEIVAGLRSGDNRVWDLFDVAGGIRRRFEQITDRVSWNGSEILWDGDPIHSVLADQLARAVQEGKSANYTALAKFWEKVESNPEPHSREQAYDFLAAHKFQITPEGDVIGFKGVSKTYTAADGVDVYHSVARSQVTGVPSAFVNGKPIEPLSTVPQSIGDTVTMPRSEVAHDPTQACKRGLHVATHGYASGYGTVLEVHVNPRDIVSVPNDGLGAKVRVCRYYVAGVAGKENEYGQTVVRESNSADAQWAGDVGYKV
jgi:hypothetical protein